MPVPSELKYTNDHEWLAIDGDEATVGITEYAADALGDVVYVDLPEVGSTVRQGQTCGEVESTKSVSDLFSPADGEVIAINETVVADPTLVNTQPFGDGWLFRVRVTATAELLDAEAYRALTEGA